MRNLIPRTSAFQKPTESAPLPTSSSTVPRGANDLGAGIEHDQIDVKALVPEEAALMRDVERGIACRSAGADCNLLDRVRG